MPITVKLSRKFYDTFGEDVVNELVEWFNVIDATYHNNLRELNELNFSRFRAEMSQQLSSRLGELDAKWERRFAEMENRMVRLEEGLRSEMNKLRADLVKWMFIFWATTALGVIGLIRF